MLKICVLQAGLITEMRATNLTIMLEGDAAYAYCKQLDPKKDLMVRLNDRKQQRMDECRGVLVLDAGGRNQLRCTTPHNVDGT